MLLDGGSLRFLQHQKTKFPGSDLQTHALFPKRFSLILQRLKMADKENRQPIRHVVEFDLH